MQISDFTFRVGVDAVVSVQLLMSLLFVDGLAKYCVSVYDIDWLFLVCALSRRHLYNYSYVTKATAHARTL